MASTAHDRLWEDRGGRGGGVRAGREGKSSCILLTSAGSAGWLTEIEAPAPFSRSQARAQTCLSLASAVFLSPLLPSLSDGDGSPGAKSTLKRPSDVRGIRLRQAN